LEVVLRIVRAGRSLGMILDGHDRKGLVAHALDAAIVKIDVGHFNLSRKTVGVHCKAMIV
jgi:hypothetical protein